MWRATQIFEPRSEHALCLQQEDGRSQRVSFTSFTTVDTRSKLIINAVQGHEDSIRQATRNL